MKTLGIEELFCMDDFYLSEQKYESSNLQTPEVRILKMTFSSVDND